DLSHCIQLTHLPSQLEVEEDLTLSHCIALISLPEGLTVQKDLILHHCVSMSTLPHQLQVKGSLDLSHTSLTHLPEDLEVGKDFSLYGCTFLTLLPQGLKIKGFLDLSETALITLPEGLEVGKDLHLTKCTALRVMPKRLKVGGSLNGSYCTSLRELPEYLEVGRDLILLHCIALTALPREFHLGGNLNLTSCSHITSLPNWIGELGRCKDGSTRIVDLTGSSLSLPILSRLQELSSVARGVRFYFSLESFKTSDLGFKTLLSALQFWEMYALEEPSFKLETGHLETVCQKFQQRKISLKDQENLLTFLTRLTVTADFQNKVTRTPLAIQLLQLLKLMADDLDISSQAALLIHQGLSSCDDRVMTTFSDLMLYQKLYRLQQDSVTAEELKTAARGLFLLEELNKKITLYTRELYFVDEVEVTMAFHIRLQQMLELPLETKGMLFRGCVSISDEEINRVGELVLQEMTQSSFEAFLAVWNPWNRYQRRLLVSPWENLPTIDQKASLTDICPYLQDTPEQPVLYNNVVYDYAPFIRRYIEEGVDLTREKVHIDRLFRMEFLDLSPS
ncbi:MAG: NEL-type E3 ubiquitin ligase domain-containing protein, partial [Candidatus Rhabdochlamydia sp.]